MRVQHLGNTANNAFHNALLLEQHAGIASDLPIRMFGLEHAISAPAWDVVNFAVPGVDWVSAPDWSMVPEAAALNTRYADLPTSTATPTEAPAAPRGLVPRTEDWARRRLAAWYGKRWAQPVFDLAYRLVLARRSALPESADAINLLYGADSLKALRTSAESPRTVCLEHGTVRWIADGGRETAVFRRAYRDQVSRAQLLWVTNLDPRTLEIAEDVAPGRWSAFPHPYVFDDRVPFATDETHRDALLRDTDAEHLILLPSSQNWSPTHDKGSIKALNAFIELRRRGHAVGLVAVEWGLQLEESKALLRDAGVGQHVAWVPPMARLGLQRMMADVDVVWDQFGLDAFGALALRALEQGTPLVSRGLKPEGERLIGGPVPWEHATDVDEIIARTTGILDRIGVEGRDAVLSEYQARYRGWLHERHAPQLTAELQAAPYARMVSGDYERGQAAPDAWARLLADRDGGAPT